MFNRKRIKMLEAAVVALQQEKFYYLRKFDELRADLVTLAQHSGVDFETEKTRKLILTNKNTPKQKKNQ